MSPSPRACAAAWASSSPAPAAQGRRGCDRRTSRGQARVRRCPPPVADESPALVCWEVRAFARRSPRSWLTSSPEARLPRLGSRVLLAGFRRHLTDGSAQASLQFEVSCESGPATDTSFAARLITSGAPAGELSGLGNSSVSTFAVATGVEPRSSGSFRSSSVPALPPQLTAAASLRSPRAGGTVEEAETDRDMAVPVRRVLAERLPGRELRVGSGGGEVGRRRLVGEADHGAVDVHPDRSVRGGVAGGRVDARQQVGPRCR